MLFPVKFIPEQEPCPKPQNQVDKRASKRYQCKLKGHKFVRQFMKNYCRRGCHDSEFQAFKIKSFPVMNQRVIRFFPYGYHIREDIAYQQCHKHKIGYLSKIYEHHSKPVFMLNIKS